MTSERKYFYLTNFFVCFLNGLQKICLNAVIAVTLDIVYHRDIV